MSPEDGSSHTAHPEDYGVYDATLPTGFACLDLTTFCGVDEHGLVVTGQRIEPDRAVLACRVAKLDQWCRRCGCEETLRDSHLAVGARAGGLAPDNARGRRARLPLHRLRTRVASGYHCGGRVARQGLTPRVAVGAGRSRGRPSQAWSIPRIQYRENWRCSGHRMLPISIPDIFVCSARLCVTWRSASDLSVRENSAPENYWRNSGMSWCL